MTEKYDPRKERLVALRSHAAKLIERLDDDIKEGRWHGSPAGSALRRQSMEMSRALADYRAGHIVERAAPCREA